MYRTIPTVLAAALLLLSGAPLTAAADAGISVEFSDEEVRIIGAWYEERGARTGNGKAGHRQKGLPPGIAKNLSRGKSLPPGIAKQNLPDSLVHELPPPPRGFERVIVDGKVLLIEVATQVIHDVLSDIVLR